jgi:hypothetical protein
MNEEDFATATRSSKGCDPKLNESTEASAIKCLQQQGIFYDGCSHRCEREMSFLRLSQGFELEHFVYGYVSLFVKAAI